MFVDLSKESEIDTLDLDEVVHSEFIEQDMFIILFLDKMKAQRLRHVLDEYIYKFKHAYGCLPLREFKHINYVNKNTSNQIVNALSFYLKKILENGWSLPTGEDGELIIDELLPTADDILNVAHMVQNKRKDENKTADSFVRLLYAFNLIYDKVTTEEVFVEDDSNVLCEETISFSTKFIDDRVASLATQLAVGKNVRFQDLSLENENCE